MLGDVTPGKTPDQYAQDILEEIKESGGGASTRHVVLNVWGEKARAAGVDRAIRMEVVRLVDQR